MKQKQILFLLFFIPSVFLQGQSFLITGIVKNELQQPIAGWPVTIESLQGFWPPVNETVYTNSFGLYSFSAALSDTMVIPLRVSTPDCNQVVIDTLINVQSGQNYTVDFIICDPTPCVASFYYLPEGDTIQANTFRFYNTSTGPFTNLIWDFGDGTTSTISSPVHTFGPGIWTVCLTISSNTCSDSSCIVISVNTSPCSNEFSYSTSYLSVDFSAWVSGPLPAVFQWDFGDGATGSGQITNHTYGSSGIFLVTLMTTDADSCTATSTQWIEVQSESCSAGYSFVPDPQSPGLIYYTDLSSGNVVAWNWDFGDGQQSGENSPQHLFEAGTWNVCLSIETALGCTDTYCTLITVSSAGGCQAGFYWSYDPANPLLIHFTDSSSGNINSRRWDFGDGNSSSEINPDHSFAEAGTYNVCLTVYSADSVCQSVICHLITVDENLYFPIFGQVLADFFPADSVIVELYKSKKDSLQLLKKLIPGHSVPIRFSLFRRALYLKG